MSVCYWFHPSSVDQTTVCERMPVESCAAGCSVERQLMVLATCQELDAIRASLAAELGRSGRALRLSPQVRGSVVVHSNVITPSALSAYSF